MGFPRGGASVELICGADPDPAAIGCTFGSSYVHPEQRATPVFCPSRMRMLIKSIGLFLVSVTALTSLAATPKVTLRGKAQSCHPGMPIRLVGTQGVNISAFQVSKVPSLLSYLKAMDTTTITGEASMMRMDTLATKADSLATASIALVRVVSDSLGNFKLSIPVTDSVLVYGVWDDEDDTFPQTYKTISGRVDSYFILDLAHGGCTPFSERKDEAAHRPGGSPTGPEDLSIEAAGRA